MKFFPIHGKKSRPVYFAFAKRCYFFRKIFVFIFEGEKKEGGSRNKYSDRFRCMDVINMFSKLQAVCLWKANDEL